MADLLDVNVWLAMGVRDHPHYERAQRYWFEQAPESACFCRVTALGLLRLLTNRHVMNDQPLSVDEAWEAYQQFRALPEVDFRTEPDDCERQMQALTWGAAISNRIWTDAYLAAFALSSGLRLVSFDSDFHRFDGLSFLHLQ